jgi:hypothetical protein
LIVLFIQQAGASAGPVVVFPDDYPNSVRHFLLIGFLAMFIGAGCFFYLGLTRKVNSLFHTVVFFICAVTAWCVSPLLLSLSCTRWLYVVFLGFAVPPGWCADRNVPCSSSYYANWSGLGVEYKTTDETPRVIFWSRYFDWVVTGPVRQNIVSLEIVRPLRSLSLTFSFLPTRVVALQH